MKKIFFTVYSIVFISYSLFSQNVGIGVSNPTRAKLEQHGTVGATSAIFGGETTGISLQSNWPGIGFNQYYNLGSKYIATGYAAVLYLDQNNGSMALDMFLPGNANAIATFNRRALTIGNTGNVGIANVAFTSSLFAQKGINYDGAAVFGGTTHNSYFNYGPDEHTYIRGGKNGSKVFLNDIPGNKIVFGSGNSVVGINSGNPACTLEIVQTGEKGLVIIDPAWYFNRWAFLVNHYLVPPDSHLRTYYNDAGVGAFYPNGGYTGTVSDRRIKSNITDLPKLMDKLMQLDPVGYEMKDHNDNHEKTIGFIAQDVKELFPPLVSVKQVTVDSVNRIPDLHALDYTGLSVITIKAIQEQYKEITALQKENDNLLQKLEVLEKKLNEID